MTDPDSATDPEAPTHGSADASDGAGRGVAGGDDPTAGEDDPQRGATPRLANASDPDGGADRPAAFREPEPIEPETPRPENVLFVVLGVLGTVGLLATAVVPGLI